MCIKFQLPEYSRYPWKCLHKHDREILFTRQQTSLVCESDSTVRFQQDLLSMPHILQDMILKGFDDEARRFIKKIYEDQGVTIHLFTSPKKVDKGNDGKLTVTAETKDGKEVVLSDVDDVLFATGRKPNTKDLGLETADVELDDKGGVKVSPSQSFAIYMLFGANRVLSAR